VTSNANSYDEFALIYNRHWGPQYADVALDTLDPLLLSRIPPGSRILDLCCGSGQTSRRLEDRGYRIKGIDKSPALIAFAKINAPHSTFAVADARHFKLPAHFEAAISLSDSLNHLLTLDDLRSAFRQVESCLIPGGLFVFDLNLAYKYETSWAGSMAVVDEDAVCAVVTSSDVSARLARFEAATFTKVGDLWTRKDVSLAQSWYTPEEVTSALNDVGFIDTRITDRRGNLLQNWDIKKAYFSTAKAG
jgi:SAM-dependent methyltransferase